MSEVFQHTVVPLLGRLYRYAYRLTGNERDAEDLVQDTTLRAMIKFDQYEQGTSASAWLLVVMRSIFINKYRKKKREGHKVSLEDLPYGEEVPQTDPKSMPNNPEAFFFHDVLDGELRDALHNLPRHYLEVIVLVDLEELSYREVGEVLNIPTGTVMSRLHRARKTLQKQLQELALRKGIIKSNITDIKSRQSEKKVQHGT